MRVRHATPNPAWLLPCTAALVAGLCLQPTDSLGAPIKSLASGGAALREAGDHLVHGKPNQVVALLSDAALLASAKTLGKKKGRKRTAGETSVLVRALLDLGRIKEARAALKRCRKSSLCALEACRLEQRFGRRKTAVKVCGRALKKHPKDVRIQLEMGLALNAIGKTLQGRKLLDPMADWYQQPGLKHVPQIIAVARSLSANGYFKDANTVMAEAAEAAVDEADRLAVEAAWGQLFLSKYNFRDADGAFEKVLAINPRHARAVAGMARIDIDSDHNISRARKRLDELLKVRPNSIPVLVMRAEVALHDEDPSAARTLLKRALAQHPDDAAALHVLAATCKLMDDNKCFAATEKKALRANAHDGEIYVVTARYLEMAHRYREVLQLLRKALARDADLWHAHAALGMSYARIADDKQARKHLETSFTNDPYNVRTANVLNVLYDGVLKHMHLLEGEHVDLRVHRRDRKGLERTVLPFLQESWRGLSKKYAMKPAKPLVVEIFPTTEQFSVRTVGLPRLGAHAVCFGHLITSRSPGERPFNWKMVLHHEMAHVFHIRASDGRVPRWLTEGMAMMESAWRDPRWHIIAERRAWERLKAGKLAPVARFNLAFSQARSIRSIVEAYYQSMLLVRFLDQRWGFDKLRTLVAGYRTGKSTAALIKKHYGMAPADIDRQFAAWLTKKLARFERDFRPTPAQVKARLAGEWKASNPARKALGKAMPLLAKGRRMQARRALESVLINRHRKRPDAAAVAPGGRAADPTFITLEQCTAGYFLMELAVSDGNWPQAAPFARRLVTSLGGRCDGVRQRVVLARAVTDPGAFAKEAMPHLEKAWKIDSRDPALLGMWLKMLDKVGDTDGQRSVARKLIALDPNGVSAPLLLANLAWQELAPTLGLAETASSAASRKKLRKKASAKSKKKKGPPDAARKAALLADLSLAANALEESAPLTRAAVLFEARLAVARGKPAMALPVYRLAAERAKGDAARKTAWCELAKVATKAKATADQAEADRRCKAEQADL